MSQENCYRLGIGAQFPFRALHGRSRRAGFAAAIGIGQGGDEVVPTRERSRAAPQHPYLLYIPESTSTVGERRGRNARRNDGDKHGQTAESAATRARVVPICKMGVR